MSGSQDQKNENYQYGDKTFSEKKTTALFVSATIDTPIPDEWNNN